MIHKLERFVRESNLIEGIRRKPTNKEIETLDMFLAIRELRVADIENFVNAYQPGAKLRDKYHMDVMIGYDLLLGCPEIRQNLETLVENINSYKTDKKAAVSRGITPFQLHVEYEKLHPFMDGNGRSGRAIWLWMHGRHSIEMDRGFLHSFYYETLTFIK